MTAAIRPRPLLAVAAAMSALVMAACGATTTPSTSPTAASTSAASTSAGATSATSSGTTTQCSYEQSGQAAKKVDPPKTSGVATTGDAVFVMTTNAGAITVTSDRSKTPCTINSFESLVQQNFYDDTRCHRLVTEGIFVLQCGDPTASGSGGPGYSFPDELSGSETYPAGTVAMANAGPDTNGSQFFLVYADSPLRASYTVFGEMDAAGLAVVKKIAADGVDASSANSAGDGKPVNPAQIDTVVEN